MDMSTITEDYVSFEMAKLLKEKGFDEPCCGSYSYRGGNVVVRASKLSNTDLCYHPDISGISAPTLQMAMRWLRKVHNAFISIIYENDGVFVANLKVPLKGIDCLIDYKHNCWFTYEEAAEAAIEYCLKILI